MLTPADRAQLASLARSRLFWDTRPEDIDWDAHALWVIARVLWYGTLEDCRRIQAVYGPTLIRQALDVRGALPPGVRAFWLTHWPWETVPRYREALHPANAAVLARYGAALCPAGFSLAGDTALVLSLGHRAADTLEFVTADPFDPEALAPSLTALDLPIRIDTREADRLEGSLDGVPITYRRQRGVALEPGGFVDDIPLVSLRTLMALTCHALTMRGTRRDVVDLFALAQMPGGLAHVVDTAMELAPHMNRVHLVRSLGCFEDAETTPMPPLREPWDWATIRSVMARDVAVLVRHAIRSPT